MAGSIKLFRQFREWGWYQDVNVKSLFIELLLIARYSDGDWQNIHMKRGQLVVSLARLSESTGLSVHQVRTALEKLESTGEIKRQVTNRFSLITVCNYDKWQTNDGEEWQANDNQTANECQSNGNQVSNDSQANDKQMSTFNKENKEIKNNISTTTTTISRESNEKWMAELERTETESFSTICLGLKINNETYFEFLEGFRRECKMQDTIHLSWNDTRKHFIGWCRCEMDRRSKQNKNGNNNANSQSNSRRYWYEPTGEEDYSGDSL